MHIWYIQCRNNNYTASQICATMIRFVYLSMFRGLRVEWLIRASMVATYAVTLSVTTMLDYVRELVYIRYRRACKPQAF